MAETGAEPGTVRRRFPWEASYPPGIRWDSPIATGMIPALLDRTAATFADKPALTYGADTLTYRAFAEAVDQAAAGLAAIGVGRGVRVAFLLPNSPWHPIFFFATLKVGGTIVHVSPLDAEREVQHKLADSGARIVVTTDLAGLAERAFKLKASRHIDTVIVGEDLHWRDSAPITPIPDALSGAAMLSARAVAPIAPADANPSDIAVLQYTGGTTGVPKAAVLTHANLTAAVSIYEAWSRPQGFGEPGAERILCVLPLFHIYALTAALLNGVASGAEIILHTRFDTEAVIADIERRRVTMFAGVPTMWTAIANHPGIESRDFSSLRGIRSGGAACPIEIENRIMAITGLRLGGGWGMTETCPAGSNIPTGGPKIPQSSLPNKPGTIGLPLPGIEMQIVALDDPKHVLPTGERGEIRVRGPNVISRYLNRPKETAAAFVDGWLLTGDIGHCDQQGFFYLVDRKTDMIISGGFNVYPRAIEEAIYEHASVAEAMVIGVPDAYRGEAAKAFVVLRSGAQAFTLEALRAFLADKIGRHELPAHLEFRDALPKTAVGKLSKRALIAEMKGR
jgi:long-chain acyl-CoA synthetase